MRPPPSGPGVSSRMRAQKVKDTGIEVALRRALFRRGLRFRLQGPVVPGTRRRADLEFRGARVAVFVDGCFWHSCPEHRTAPAANAQWWSQKLQDTCARDADSTRRLSEAGWAVVRVWEHEPADSAADRVSELVRARTAQVAGPA